jgi:Flp pilus assembly protein TadG
MAMTQRLRSQRGQSLVEFALIIPFIIVVAFGVIEVGYALLDQHIVTKLTREGSNLISRDVKIDDVETAMRNMSVRPVDFDTRSRMILTVLRKGGTPGTPNYDRVIVYQRREFGNLTGVETALQTSGTGAYRGAPDYEAVNADTDTRIQLSSLPGSLTMDRGNTIYVTEIFTQHDLITPLSGFGLRVPSTLYSIAYF